MKSFASFKPKYLIIYFDSLVSKSLVTWFFNEKHIVDMACGKWENGNSLKFPSISNLTQPYDLLECRNSLLVLVPTRIHEPVFSTNAQSMQTGPGMAMIMGQILELTKWLLSCLDLGLRVTQRNCATKGRDWWDKSIFKVIIICHFEKTEESLPLCTEASSVFQLKESLVVSLCIRIQDL